MEIPLVMTMVGLLVALLQLNTAPPVGDRNSLDIDATLISVSFSVALLRHAPIIPLWISLMAKMTT